MLIEHLLQSSHRAQCLISFPLTATLGGRYYYIHFKGDESEPCQLRWKSPKVFFPKPRALQSSQTRTLPTAY